MGLLSKGIVLSIVLFNYRRETNPTQMYYITTEMCIYSMLSKAHIRSVTHSVFQQYLISFHFSIHNFACAYVYLSTSSRLTGTPAKKAWQRKNDTT